MSEKKKSKKARLYLISDFVICGYRKFRSVDANQTKSGGYELCDKKDAAL